MKRFLSIAISVLAFTLVLGCHINAQIPPQTKHVVDLSWTAAVPAVGSQWGGCTTAAPCVYAVYRCTTSASACGDTTNSAWIEITTSTTRPSGVTYTDPNPAVGQNYYNVTTIQGASSSGPSNIANAAVPASPNAPGLNNPTIAANTPPLAPIPSASEPMLAYSPVHNLKARAR